MSVAPRSPATLEAVLFDMDGLLVDSEPMWFEVESEVMSGLGATWTHEQARGLVGNSLERSAQMLLGAANATGDPAALAHELVDRMVGLISRGASFKPGATELLAALRDEGIPIALVSSSYRRLVDAVVDQLPAGSFAVTVAGDEVEQPKPDPEPYLTAMAALGVEPAGCVVLEDSPTGAAAGNAAGAYVIAVPDLAAVPTAQRRTVRHTLTGLSVPELARITGVSVAPRVSTVAS